MCNEKLIIEDKADSARDCGRKSVGIRKQFKDLPVRFDWGYALAWHEGDEIKVVSALATTGTERTKIVDKISDKKVPGFCFAPILKVLIDGEWKYDSELSDEDSWKAYWNIQAEMIKSLLGQCPL